MKDKPLSGIRVLEMGLHVAAPACALILEKYGAEVIKIEQKGSGDPWHGTATYHTRTPIENSPIYDIYNMGKRSVVIDYKTPEGMAVLEKLLEKADIFLTNVRLKSLKKNGLDPKTLCAKFPRLIYGRVSGYGDLGPEAGVAAFDNNAFWARSGLAADMVFDNGADAPEPLLSGCGIGDSITASLLATAVTAALYRREKSGRGEELEVSLYGTGIWVSGCMSLMAADQYWRKFPRTLPFCDLCDFAYRCRDGRYVKVGLTNAARDYPVFMEILGITDDLAALGFTKYRDYTSHSSDVIPLMKQAFLAKDAPEWIRLMLDAGFAVNEAVHFRDIGKDPQAIANGYVYEYRMRGGDTCMMPDYPVRIGSADNAPFTVNAPLVGEQSAEILRELGFGEDFIGQYLERFV